MNEKGCHALELSRSLACSLLFSSLCVCFSPRTASVLSACSPCVLYPRGQPAGGVNPMHACRHPHELTPLWELTPFLLVLHARVFNDRETRRDGTSISKAKRQRQWSRKPYSALEVPNTADRAIFGT